MSKKLTTLRDLPHGRLDADKVHQLDWRIGPVGHSRDSDLIEETNWDFVVAAFAEADPEGIDHEVHRFGHFAVGWIEEIAYRADSPVASHADEIRNRLDVYPILNKDAYSEAESEAESANLRDIMADLRNQVAKAIVDIEYDGEYRYDDMISDLDTDTLYDATVIAQVSGESDGEGWRRYSNREAATLAKYLLIPVALCAAFATLETT